MKRQIREHIRRQLVGRDGMTRYARSLAACKHLTSTGEFAHANVVMIYLSLPDEVDTAAIALAAWQRGKTVVAPKIFWENKRMLPIEIDSLETGITDGRHGLVEPEHGQPMPIDMIDLVVVPGLAFDHQGHRLGRGAGFYDRFLSQPEFRAIKCGLAFQEQLLDALPVEGHDMSVDMLATDEEVMRFDAPRPAETADETGESEAK